MSKPFNLKSHREAMRAIGLDPMRSNKSSWPVALGFVAAFVGLIITFRWLSNRAYNKSRPTSIQPSFLPFFKYLDARRIWKKDIGYCLEHFGSRSALINVLEFENELYSTGGHFINLVLYPINAKRIDLTSYAMGTASVKNTRDVFKRIISSVTTKLPSPHDITQIGATLRRAIAILSMAPDAQADIASSFLKSSLDTLSLLRYDAANDWYYVDESSVTSHSVPLSMLFSNDNRLSFAFGPTHSAISGPNPFDYTTVGTVFYITKRAVEILTDLQTPNVKAVVNLYSVIASLANVYERAMHDPSKKYLCAIGLLSIIVLDNASVFFPDVKTSTDVNGNTHTVGPDGQLNELQRVQNLHDYIEVIFSEELVISLPNVDSTTLVRILSDYDNGVACDSSTEWRSALDEAKYTKDGDMVAIAKK